MFKNILIFGVTALVLILAVSNPSIFFKISSLEEKGAEPPLLKDSSLGEKLQIAEPIRKEQFAPKIFITPPVISSGEEGVGSQENSSILPSFEFLKEPKTQPLPLPQVSESDLTIKLSGISQLSEYLQYFSENSSKIDFDMKRLSAVAKNSSGIILSVNDFIDQAIYGAGFKKIHNDLEIWKEFIGAKVNFLKSIAVFGSGVKLSQNMIAIDLLTLDLINKAFKVEQELLSETDFKAFYSQYNETVAFQRDVFRSGASLSKSSLRSLFVKRANALGATLPFGGFISLIQECTCLGGYIMYLSPGFSPAPGTYAFFISYATISSPLLFLNKSPVTGHWILGNYLATPGPCLSAAFCIPTGAFIGIVSLAGTS